MAEFRFKKIHASEVVYVKRNVDVSKTISFGTAVKRTLRKKLLYQDLIEKLFKHYILIF